VFLAGPSYLVERFLLIIDQAFWSMPMISSAPSTFAKTALKAAIYAPWT